MQLLRPLTTATAFVRTLFMPFKVIGHWFKKIGRVKIPAWVWASLHVILLVVVCVVVLFVYWRWEWYNLVPRGGKFVQALFPVLIILLVYAAIRLVLYILRQIPTAQSAFPDIELAVNEGLAALRDAGVNVADVPLFLVVGFTPQDERAIAESPLVGRDVRVTDADLALHWYGDHKAIWVTMPKVSAATAQSAFARGARRSATSDYGDPNRTIGGGGGDGAFNTLGPINPGQYATMAVGVVEAEPAAAATEAYQAPAKRLDADERERFDRRIRFFVELLKEARYPVCPANGVLLGVPHAWLTSPGLAQLADVIKVDMHALQDALGVRCITAAVVTGIEQVQEFRTYIGRLDKSQLERRFGCGFPAPSLYCPNSEDLDLVHNWLVRYCERQVFELFQQKLGDPTNGDLFRLLDKVRRTRPNFLRVFKHAFPDDVDEPFYLGGVYFASFEPAGGVRAPFFDGVLARLLKEHDDVIGWSDKSLAEDRRMQRLARGFWIAAGVLVVLNGVWLFVLLASS